MNLKNPILTFIMIAVLVFATNLSITNARSLIQPKIGSMTNINAGTERIMDMIQDEPDDNEEYINSDIDNNDISSDIEVFVPPPKLKNINNEDHITNKQINNKTIDQKQENININIDHTIKKTTDNDVNNIDNESNLKSNSITLKKISSDDTISQNSTSQNSAKSKVITSVSGGKLKVDTNRGGGEIDNKISGVDIAFVRELKTYSGKLVVGGVIDYSHDNYDSKVDEIKGTGDTDAIIAGIIVKQTHDDGVYYECSTRIGRAKTDFNSNNFIINDQQVHVSYKESVPIYAGHAKIGKIIKNNEKKQTDIYGAYVFSHQNNNNIKLSTNDTYTVGSIDSECVKIGCRMTTKVKDGKIYYGISYQHEASGKIKIMNNKNDEIHVSSAKGGSGSIELGYKINAKSDNTLNLDLNASGFTGRQNGFIIKAQLIKLC